MVFLPLSLHLSSFASSTENRNQEYLLLKVPGLSEIGTMSVGWFILRKGEFWNGKNKVNLNEISWPFWDKNQVPAILVPAQNQNSTLEIFDSNKSLITKKKLNQPHSFFQKDKSSEKIPKYFSVTNSLLDGRIEIQTGLIELPKPRSILNCQIKKTANSLLENSQFKSCINSLKGYFNPDQKLEKQMYLNLAWPKPINREERVGLKQIIRDFRNLSKKSGIVFTSDEDTKEYFSAEIGMTNSEQLQPIQISDLRNMNHEKALFSPKSYEEKSLAYEYVNEGTKISFYFFSNDFVSKTNLSESFGDSLNTNLQIIKNTENNELEFKTTSTLENRTGAISLLRGWKAIVFANANTLVSNKGEREQIYGLPGVEIEKYIPEYSAFPFLKMETQLLHLGSNLALTELAFGSLFRVHWLSGLKAKVGYLQYSLSGTNDGASRLGTFRAPHLGFHLDQVVDQWNFFQSVDLFMTKSFSYTIKTGVAWNTAFSNSEYLRQAGLWIGYSDYRAEIRNKLGNLESLSESRLQFSIFAGALGPDYANSIIE